MHPNKNYEQDIEYVTKQSHFLLRILGIWPLVDRDLSAAEMIYKILLIIVCCILVCFEGIPVMLYCMFITEEEPGSKLKMIAPMIYSFNALAKYGTLIVYENEIRSCLKHIKDDWKSLSVLNARDIMMDKAKTGRHMFTICCTFLYFAGLSYHTIVPLSRGRMVTSKNITIRPLAYAGYFVLFDEQLSPAYEIVFLLQFFGGFVMYSVTIVIYGLAALLVMHACAQMKILMILMEEFVDKQTCKEKIVDKKLAMEWQDGNTANVCTFLVALASDTVNIFLLCYIGEHITATTDQVAWTINTLEWYRLPTKMTRDIVLMVFISHIPLKITAGKFITLSFKTFGDVMKSVVVYFNILCTVTE
nr:PREDICTED: uncharacterized protein LOC105676654 [Linepithema humile]